MDSQAILNDTGRNLVCEDFCIAKGFSGYQEGFAIAQDKIGIFIIISSVAITLLFLCEILMKKHSVRLNDMLMLIIQNVKMGCIVALMYASYYMLATIVFGVI